MAHAEGAHAEESIEIAMAEIGLLIGDFEVEGQVADHAADKTEDDEPIESQLGHPEGARHDVVIDHARDRSRYEEEAGDGLEDRGNDAAFLRAEEQEKRQKEPTEYE